MPTMSKSLAVCLVVAIWIATSPAADICAEESALLKAYQANWQAAQQAYSAQDFRRAATHYSKVGELLPFEPTSRFQLAGCYARLGDKARAFEALEAAIRFGWDDSQRIEQSEDLKDLRSEPRFSELVKAAAACEQETLVMHIGPSVNRKLSAPLIVLLQGLGCGPRSDVPYWKEAADRLGAIVVAPRAVTRIGPMFYGWHRLGAKDSTVRDYFDLAAAGKRIDDAIERAKQQCAIDDRRMILAGFSQGGGVALHMLGDRPDQFCGAVAVGSLYQPPGANYWRSVKDKRKVRVAMIVGRLDRLFPRNETAAEQLRAAGLELQYGALDKIGHEYPADYSQRFDRALGFVIGQKAP